MSSRNQKKADEPQIRRRTTPGQNTVGASVGHDRGAESHHIGQGPYQSSSSATSIANQKSKVSLKSEAVSPSRENLSEKIRAMGTLTTQAQRLGEEQSQHSERAQQLEEQIKQSEVKLGKMIQDFLQLERALELKKKHIQEDREARERELSSYQSKTEQIRSIIARINAIATEENAGSLTGTSGESRSQA